MNKKLLNLLNKNNYTAIKNILNNENAYDIANILNDLDLLNIVKLYRLLPKDLASDVFAYLDSDMQIKLISSLTDNEAVNIINELYADDAADLIEEMPANVVSKLLSKVSKETRGNLNLLLKYPDNSAGSIMTVEYLDFKDNSTIKDAIIKIRQEADEVELTYNSFVLDKNRKLLGVVDLKDILINDEETKINDVMNTNFISANTLADQEDIAKLFRDYDLTIMPIVDSENRLVGIITIDDIIDIIQSETTEDIAKMAAVTPSETPYLKQSVWSIYKNRIVWLLFLMVSATFTGHIIKYYESCLSTYIILTTFIPMLMSCAGNAGSQSSATIIRGLSINDITFKDIFKIMGKEIRVSLMIGITLAIANFGKLILIDHVALNIALCVCLALIFIVMLAKFVGSTLPILAHKIGLDPTVMATPLISTILDALSLFIFFLISSSILHI